MANGQSFGNGFLAPRSAGRAPNSGSWLRYIVVVFTGDMISLDVSKRSIHLGVSDAELQQRRDQWKPQPRRYERGYGWMFSQHIQQADQGCDFDFLETRFGAPVAEPDIY